MKKGWLFQDVLREEADGTGGGTGDAAPKTTVTINGKEVDMATVAAAHNLYTSLADPETGKEIIHQLALRTGILKENEVPTKAEEKKIEARFTKLMKAKLGKDFDPLSDKLGPVFDEAMEIFKNELREEQAQGSDSGNWDSTIEDFVSNNEFTPEIETEMQRLITRNGGRPAGLKGKAAREYLTDMYALACHKLGIDVEVEDVREAKQGRTPTGRRSRRSEVPEFREEARPKGVLTIDQIVDAALRGVRFKQS